jgi:hypothetical protein
VRALALSPFFLVDPLVKPQCAFLQAATKLWPHLFDTSEALNSKDKILSDMHTVRPVVETGYVYPKSNRIFHWAAQHIVSFTNINYYGTLL